MARAVAMRRTLRNAGFAVDARGPETDRLRRAWAYYKRFGPVSKSWNMNNPRKNEGDDDDEVMPPAGARGPAGSPFARAAHVVHRASQRAKKRTRQISPPKRRARQDAAGLAGGGGGGGHDHVEDIVEESNFPGVPMPSAGGHGTARILGRDMADELAGYQFDPQIHELLTQLEQGRRDEGQAQSDIGNWYGQVRGSQETARQRDVEAGTRARGDVQRALDGILTSLGGSRGAGMVGAAGLSDLTALASQGASQDRYNADMAPLLAAEEAGAHSRQAALASQTRKGRQAQLVGLRGQKGQARSKALMDIIQFNNQGRQTNFQNRLALQNAALAAASLGLNADQTYAGIEAQRATTRQNEKKLRMMGLEAQQQTGNMNWARLNYPDRQTVIQDAVARAVQAMDPDNFDDQYARFAAYRNLRAGGFKSAQGPAYQGRVPSKRSRRQIQMAVEDAVRRARRQWESKRS